MRPTTPQTRRPRFLLSFGACALAVAATWAALTPPPAADPTYSLVEEAPDGNLYALDYGLTLDDCRRSELGADKPVTFCEAEG